MTNKDVAGSFQELAKLMELHAENTFKIRSYQNAYMHLRKMEQPLQGMTTTELAAIKGIGKAISSKIKELADTGKMETLEKYREITPKGVQEMLTISGFGPKKVRTVWKDLGVESIGELLYAVNENRLLDLKGFGVKTQEDLKIKLVYFQSSRNRFLYAGVASGAEELLTILKNSFPNAIVEPTGAIRRQCPILSEISILIAGPDEKDVVKILKQEETTVQNGIIKTKTTASYPVSIYVCDKKEWGSKQFRYTASDAFMTAFLSSFPNMNFKNLAKEEEVFVKAGIAYLPPALREDERAVQIAKEKNVPHLIQEDQIFGVIHNHTTDSDGVNTLEEMAAYAKELGYKYIGITDHSKAAFYANGLKEEQVLAQMKQIDELNEKDSDFRILKGIESDILADGSLDYEEDILKQFDFIIASIHTNLSMDENKATRRLIAAIENPYTGILGHPTGRLLLSRPGYPINHRKIIDACAANQVAIELNANPLRLDMDWRWIPYALEKGVFISINPDAHSRKGMHDIYYGILVAQKGGLSAKYCLNALNVASFLKKVHKW